MIIFLFIKENLKNIFFEFQKKEEFQKQISSLFKEKLNSFNFVEFLFSGDSDKINFLNKIIIKFITNEFEAILDQFPFENELKLILCMIQILENGNLLNSFKYLVLIKDLLNFFIDIKGNF